MTIPYKEIRDAIGENLRASQIAEAIRFYCMANKVRMVDVDFIKLSEWMRGGLVKLRAGCSGKKDYKSRKEAKQKLKRMGRHEGDGVYTCPHCGRWHITSHLLEAQEPGYSYHLYGLKLD